MEQKEHQEKQKEELDKDLAGFNETPLNLTDEAEGDVEDPEMTAKLNQQYEKFMAQMKNFNFQDAGEGMEGMQGFADSLGGLLKGLAGSFGAPGSGSQDKQLKDIFSGDGKGIEDIASKLLDVFMKKQLLYAPLQECRTSYDEYFKKQEGKIPEADFQRFKKQYSIIGEAIEILDKEPESKNKLIDIFEKLQEYGQPPAGIASIALPPM